jgi:hypothetical protein
MIIAMIGASTVPAMKKSQKAFGNEYCPAHNLANGLISALPKPAGVTNSGSGMRLGIVYAARCAGCHLAGMVRHRDGAGRGAPVAAPHSIPRPPIGTAIRTSLVDISRRSPWLYPGPSQPSSPTSLSPSPSSMSLEHWHIAGRREAHRAHPYDASP